MRSSMRRRRGGQTAYQQTSSAAQGALNSTDNALSSAGDTLGNAGTAVVDQTKKAGNWLSGLFSAQAGGSRRHRKRSRKSKGFLGMFNIFSRKRQGRSRKGGAAIMGTIGGAPPMGANSNEMKPIGAQFVAAPVIKSFVPAAPAKFGGRRRMRRGGQMYSPSYLTMGGSTPQPYSPDVWTAHGAFPSAVGGTRRRRGGQQQVTPPTYPADGGSRRKHRKH